MPQNNEKCYNFTITATYKVKGYVFANNFSDAVKLIKNQEWDEVDEGHIEKINAINGVEEDNEGGKDIRNEG